MASFYVICPWGLFLSWSQGVWIFKVLSLSLSVSFLQASYFALLVSLVTLFFFSCFSSLCLILRLSFFFFSLVIPSECQVRAVIRSRISHLHITPWWCTIKTLTAVFKPKVIIYSLSVLHPFWVSSAFVPTVHSIGDGPQKLIWPWWPVFTGTTKKSPWTWTATSLILLLQVQQLLLIDTIV